MDCRFAITVTILWLSCAALSVIAERGYLLMVPRSLEKNSRNSLQLHLYDVNAPGKIKIELRSRLQNNTLIAEEEFSIDAGSAGGNLDFFVPDTDQYHAKIKVSGTFDTEDNYKIFGEDRVFCKNMNSKLVPIQTDKPMYKPSEVVKFRILAVDQKLKPLGGDITADVWVEDTTRARLAQWDGVPIGAMKQIEFPLSVEPNLGKWHIYVSLDGTTYSTNFEVKEYVLPKFEVTITPPPYVLSDAKEIPIEVCAKYTYGKGVEGNLKLNSSLEKYSWSNNKIPTLEVNTELDAGCYKYVINVSLIQDQYYYRRIQIVAVVTEKGTGVSMNKTITIDRSHSPFSLSFDQDQRIFFKPGLPYNDKLLVKNPDQTPAVDEPIEVCYSVSRERVIGNWWAKKKVKFCKNYTSDADGTINFTIPPQSTDVLNIYVEATSVRFQGTSSRTDESTLIKPTASSSLRPWFSKSGNHIHVQAGSGDPSCGSKYPVKTLYTSVDVEDFTFYYHVINKGKIVSSGTVQKKFTSEDDISKKYDEDGSVIIGPGILVEPDSSQFTVKSSFEDEDCPSAREARYVPPFGAIDVEVDVDATLSPDFHLLMYHILSNGETIADSQQFSVEKCFNNKVSLKFGDEEQQPGAKTSLTLNAAPNSLCGIKVVDKSITLLDSRDDLSKESVFQKIRSLDGRVYHSINHCSRLVRQPGLRQFGSNDKPATDRRLSMSSYEDSMTAFEMTGFIVISDLTLMTRPCKTMNQQPPYMHPRGSAHSRMPISADSRGPPPAAEFSGGRNKSPGNSLKSVVDVRNFFPETWLFRIEAVGAEGERITKETLPHTITEWQGSAVCVNSEEGLGISDVSTIKAFQAFFVSFTLPYSVIRGEKFTVAVTVFNYIDKDLPITVTLSDDGGYVITESGIGGDFCISGGKSVTLKAQMQATVLGVLNFTVRAKTSDSKAKCEGADVSDAVARDAVTRTLIVEAEGFPEEKVKNALLCLKDNDRQKRDLAVVVPDDVVPDSSRAILVATGNIMGPAIDNLDSLVVMPTGCGEQNMVRFTPNIFAMKYLSSIGKLTDKIERKARNNLRAGYQREMKYRHPDGSYSAFGTRDNSGSMILTAFVLRSFSQADQYISIDNRNLAETVTWVTSHQDDSGCFPEVGRIFSQSLKGSLGGSKGTITAYVLSSLLIAGFKNESIIEAAFSCMQNVDSAATPYRSALYAYSYALAGKQELAKAYLNAMKEKAIEKGDAIYFKNINGSESMDVETAAYFILTSLKTGAVASDLLPVIYWMTQKRNSRGGFISTQDTVLGLEALSEFAILIGKDPVDLTLETTGDLVETVRIDEDNKILVRKYRVAKTPALVSVEASGSGCGLVQMVHRYNTMTAPEKRMFVINVFSECSDASCQKATVNICASYSPEGKKSNMAVIEVKMVSGMVPVKETLEKLRGDPKLQLSRFDIDNNNVFFYFYELSNEDKCLEFNVEESAEVTERKPASVKVYDYYAPENSATTSYNLTHCASTNCPDEV